MALVDKKSGKVKDRVLEIPHNESFKFLEMINHFLKDEGVSLEEISGIVASGGPGSYTGTRVGISLVKGLGMGRNIPVSSVKSTEVPEDLLLLESPNNESEALVFYNTSGL